MIYYTIYTVATGEIQKVFAMNEEDTTDTITNNTGAGEAFVSGEIEPDRDTQYVVDDVLTDRPPLSDVATWDKTSITADGVDSCTLGAGLPNPTIIKVHPDAVASKNGAIGALVNVTDGSITFGTESVGSYRFEVINPFPYLPTNYTITAV